MNRRADDQPSSQRICNSRTQNGDSTKITQCRRNGKKKRKWTLGGLFKKRKTKNSDTDNSSETDSDERGFFSRSHRRIGGSYPVGDEFETQFIKHHNGDGKENDLIDYKASPKNVIRTKQQRALSSPTVDTEDSLDAIGRRLERQKVKARVEARHLRLKDSSDSENDAPAAKVAVGGSSHIIHSRCHEQSRNAAKKTRAARTNRYLQRHGLPDAVINPQSQWVSNPIYQRETPYAPRAFSAVTSPVSSPVRTRYEFSTMPYYKCDSLYGRVWSYPQLQTSPPSSVERSSPHSVPPPPPPRNPNRRVTYAVNVGRPLSYAFDARSPSKEIESYVGDNHCRGSRISQNLRELPRPELPDGEHSLTRYCADKNPRSRNPIQIIRSDAVPESAQLNAVNKVGIPFVERSSSRSPVSERQSNETTSRKYEKLQAQVKSKPKNLEEALLELEEIYNSLQLSDEELLERAERRDLQCALRSNPNFSRYSCSDLDSGVENTIHNRLHSSVGPLLPASRRSTVPDKVHDDMAYRKLRKKCTEDAKLTPNVVSQSGSFLLVSPALSPPPLVRVPPSQMTSLMSQLNREPDVTLDDVVFRNHKHSNDTLRINDPQPPFGIPLGPVLSAPNSDYLHATPTDKYRSTFNPSRIPDLVKDDLAFRNLRKDAQSGQQMLPACGAEEAKKRRAVRSLSANMIVPSKKNGKLYSGRYADNDDNDDAINASNSYRNDQQNLNHCASFNNLPDVLEAYRTQQKELLRNCDECLSTQSNNLIADEAKLLRLKLRELQALPSSKKSRAKDDRRADNKEVFSKRVAVHKPVTLSRFTIVGDDRNNPNEKIYDNSNEAENGTTDKNVVEMENSSSGVSSKSETPDSSAAARLNSTCVVNNLCCSESYDTAAPSIQQLLPWRENIKERRHQMKTTSSPTAPAARQRSRIEITLSSPQEAGIILSEILGQLMPNASLLVFAIYVIAFLHQWLFTSFSICEIFMVLIALAAFYFINDR